MDKVTFQVPVAKQLKLSAQQAALEYGFSSLQEAVRLFLSQLSRKSITIQFAASSSETLTEDEEKILRKKYREAKKDIAAKRSFSFDRSEDLITFLHAA